jgi:nucleotide-binding universal stress UspA family protein
VPSATEAGRDASSSCVLLCFDGSDAATAAIRRCARMLVARDALVLVVWTPAADMSRLDPVGDVVGRMSGLYEEWDTMADTVARRHAAAACVVAGEAGFRARPLAVAGRPAATILRVAEEHDVAAIVLGARGRGAAGGLVGGVRTRVAQKSSRPVLIIPYDREPPDGPAPPVVGT